MPTIINASNNIKPREPRIEPRIIANNWPLSLEIGVLEREKV